MPLFNVSVISVAPLSGVVTVDAKTEQLAIDAARELHRRARVDWTNDGKKAGAYTGKISHVWANPIGEGQWRVSLTAHISVTKVVAVNAGTIAEAEARARVDLSYLPEDDWRYQGRSISPIKGVLPPIQWSEPLSSGASSDYKPPTLTSLSIIPNPSRTGLDTVFAATVTTNSGKPDGSVTFYVTDGTSSTSIGSADVIAGNAVISIQAPAAGTYTYYAVYSGSDSFDASSADEQNLVVEAADELPTVTPVFDEPNDIQWDGEYLWITDKDHGYLSKVDPKIATPAVVQIIDLSPYGISTANGGARSVFIHDGYAYVAGMFSGRVVAVDIETGDVVGIGEMGPSGLSATRKVAGCAVDPVNNRLWVIGHQVGGVEDPGSHLGVFDISDMIAQFPTPVSPVVSYGPYARTDRFSNPDWVHFENIIYADGYIWGGTGSWNLFAQLSRIDVDTGVRTYWENNNAFTLDFYYRILYAHGSIWAGSWDDRIYRFNPDTFPSAPEATITLPSISNAATLAADSTSVWIVSWQWDKLARMSVAPGSEAETAALFNLDSDISSFQGIACTENYGTWLTTRFSNDKCIVRVSTSPGSESFDFRISVP